MSSLMMLFKQLNAGWVKVKSTDTRATSVDVVLLFLVSYIEQVCAE